MVGGRQREFAQRSGFFRRLRDLFQLASSFNFSFTPTFGLGAGNV